MLSLNWFDWLLLAGVVASATASFFRGFVAESFSLVGWVLAFIAAEVFYSDLAAAIALAIPGWEYLAVSAFATLIGLTLLVCLLINRRLVGFIGTPGLSLGDRLSASLFGAIRGGLWVAVIVAVLGFTSVTSSAWWQNSQLTAVTLPQAR